MALADEPGMAVYVAAAVLLGVGCATILVTSLAMMADLIGPHAQWSLRVRHHELLGQGGQWAGSYGHPEPASLLLGALLQSLCGFLPLGDGGRDRWCGRGRHPASVRSPGLAEPPSEMGPWSLALTPPRGPLPFVN